MDELNQVPNQSPLPTEVGQVIIDRSEMNFYEALKKLASGYKITRTEWNDKTTYGFLKDEKVMICIKGENHVWTISLGDLDAIDWIIVNEVNN